jgi:uncharacterized membrane protein
VSSKRAPSLALLAFLIAGCGGSGGGDTAPYAELRGTSDPSGLLVSSGGKTIVGASQFGSATWNARGAGRLTTTTDGYQIASFAAISANGSTYVGQGAVAGESTSVPILVNHGNVAPLATPVGGTDARALGVSDDGRTVLVTAHGGSPFLTYVRHDSDAPIPLDGVGLFAQTLSGDGNVVVGSFGARATRWVGAGSAEFLLPSDGDSYALATSFDGSVVVGASKVDDASSTPYIAFRWTPGGGPQDLGLLAGHAQSHAIGVSRNGHTIVGNAWLSSGNEHTLDAEEPFVWTEGTGLVALKDLVAWTGEPWGGLQQNEVTAISPDGRVVVGTSRSTDTISGIVGWRIVLPASILP